MTGSRPQPRDRAPWRAIDVNGSGAPGGPDRISCGTREGTPTRGMRRTSKTYATSPAALADACPSTARQRAGYRRSDDRTAANYAARFHPRRAVSARLAAYPPKRESGSAVWRPRDLVAFPRPNNLQEGTFDHRKAEAPIQKGCPKTPPACPTLGCIPGVHAVSQWRW